MTIDRPALDLKYPHDPDEVAYFRAFLGRMTSRARPLPTTLWHYTSANGLLGIIRSGSLYATQVACLNDATEMQHLAGLLADQAEERAVNSEGTQQQLYRSIRTAMLERDIAAVGVFVACLSNARDDLSQWRGYGSDNCSFAIELDTQELIAGLADRGGNSVMLRVIYEPDEQAELAAMMLDNTIEFFDRNATRSKDEQDRWHETFGQGYTSLSTIAHARVKHPKFRGEQEYRLFTELQHGEHETLEFSAKSTMLARHLPIRFGSSGRLPIRSVMVGPTGYPVTSRISVGDLLRKYGYPADLPVHLSEIPYRAI